MAVAPSSASRGQIVLQPPYFTSSAFVDAAREDVDLLIQSYADQYERARPAQPFTLFKDLWVSQGWTWIHFKVFDARSRDTFLKVTMRIFSGELYAFCPQHPMLTPGEERLAVAEAPIRRVAALFGLYTFFSTQPSASVPKLHSVSHIEVTSGMCTLITTSLLPNTFPDLYDAIMHLPDTLDAEHLVHLRPHVIYVLSEFSKAGAFYILPHSRAHPLNPRELPREVVVEDLAVKKRGRPSKREKKKKAKDSLVALNKWLVRTKQLCEVAGPESGEMSTHVLLSQRPTTTRANYRWYKSGLLHELSLEDDVGQAALRRANDAVAKRMRRMDEAAAARGLEVGGEGGDRTGLGRVERAVDELGERGRGGLLCLMDGAGIV